MLRPRATQLIPLAVILFWAIMIALLLRREVLVPHLRPGAGSAAAFRETPTETWMGVFLPDDVQVGFIHVRTWPQLRDGAPGTNMALHARLRMMFLGRPTGLLVSGAARTPAQGGLSDFDFTVQSGEHKMSIQGGIKDGLLSAEIQTAGESFPLQLPVSENLMLWSDMGANPMSLPPLEPGDEFFVDAFDLLTLSVGKARVSCSGREVIEINGAKVSTKVVTVTTSGMSTQAWVDDEGQVVRAQTPFGFSLERIGSEDALFDSEADTDTSLLTATAIQPTGAPVARGAKRMAVRLSGLPPEVTVPTDDTQKETQPGQFVIEPPTSEPPQDSPGLPNADEYLSGDAFVQVDHPRIKRMAADIVGPETDVWKKAVLIYRWVYENIAKNVVMSVPSALDVLESREGDCNEHTVLYTALARACGVPTRIAVGIVWSEDLNGFYYHAWPEVYAGRWIWVDPTLGQPIADAAHIKLVSGGIQKWPELLGFLGKLKVEVIE